MARDMFYTAIDLGTTKVCTVIAKIGPEGELKVLGTGIVPSQGMHKGRVKSIPETQEAVKASLTEAQRYLGKGVSWAYLGVTGNHISCVNTTGVWSRSGENGAISSRDIQALIHSSYPRVSDGKEVLHVIPISYSVDGMSGVRTPLGLHAEKVEVEAHVVLGDAPTLKNLVKTVEGCKVSVRSMVLQQVAAAEAILTEDEREIGVVMLDIGGGTTDVAIFRTGSPWYNAVIPVGGNQITRDLSVALGVPFYMAEDLKTKWGHALPESISADEEVQIPGFQSQQKRMVKRRCMSLPIHERLKETLRLVLAQVRQAGLRQLPPGGIVITGGTAETPGLVDLVRKVTGASARIAYPTGIQGLPSQLRKPACSASVGTLLWGIKHQGEGRPYKNGEKTLWGYKSFMRRFTGQPEKVAV